MAGTQQDDTGATISKQEAFLQLFEQSDSDDELQENFNDVSPTRTIPASNAFQAMPLVKQYRKARNKQSKLCDLTLLNLLVLIELGLMAVAVKRESDVKGLELVL